MIRQLSGLVNISVTQTEHGLTLTTGNGVPLVVANQSFALQANANNSVLGACLQRSGPGHHQPDSGRTAGRDDPDSRSGHPATVHATEYPGQPVRHQLQHPARRRDLILRAMPARIFLLRLPTTTDAAANFGVAITDPSLIAASSDGSAGSNGNLEQLIALRDQQLPSGAKPDGHVFQPGAASRQSRRQCARPNVTASNLSVQQLTDQRSSVSGVSLDEETTNMIRYQRAYEAGARVVTTVDSMLRHTDGDGSHAPKMRVNPDMSNDVLAAIWQTQSQENTALQQMSTGKRVNVPSDDPLAAAQMVGNQDQSNRTDQYLQNIDTLTSQLQTADTALGSVVTAVTQAITLGVQGSTGTLSAANRQQIVQNLQGIQSQLVQLANTSVGGSYLFGGTATTTPPYTLDSTSPSGVTYSGNTGTNTVQIADGLNLQTNMPGSQLFQNSAGDVFGSLQKLITSLQTGNVPQRRNRDQPAAQRLRLHHRPTHFLRQRRQPAQLDAKLSAAGTGHSEIAGQQSGRRRPDQSRHRPDPGHDRTRRRPGGGGEDSAHKPAGLPEIAVWGGRPRPPPLTLISNLGFGSRLRTRSTFNTHEPERQERGLGQRAHPPSHQPQSSLPACRFRRGLRRRHRQPAVQLDPGLAHAEQQLDKLPQHGGILLNLGLHHLRAQHGIERDMVTASSPPSSMLSDPSSCCNARKPCFSFAERARYCRLPWLRSRRADRAPECRKA